MTNEELTAYVQKALVVAESHNNQLIIGVLNQVLNWLNGTQSKPDVALLEATGTTYNFPRLIQLHDWIVAHELT